MYGLHFATVATRWDPLAGGALEVQQKMHIRKKSENFYKKIIDFNLYYTSFVPLWELAHDSATQW